MAHVVHMAIAQQLGITPEAIEGDSRLREDLGLSEAELGEVLAHAETLGLASDEFPIEALDRIRTVDELISAWEGWTAERDTYDTFDAFPLEPPTLPG